jgi:hypothetical protein
MQHEQRTKPRANRILSEFDDLVGVLGAVSRDLSDEVASSDFYSTVLTLDRHREKIVH